jgi:hypothetical protein
VISLQHKGVLDGSIYVGTIEEIRDHSAAPSRGLKAELTLHLKTDQALQTKVQYAFPPQPTESTVDSPP